MSGPGAPGRSLEAGEERLDAATVLGHTLCRRLGGLCPGLGGGAGREGRKAPFGAEWRVVF